MTFTLELVEGPLAPARLRSIAELYGRFNAKYADLQFCARLLGGGPAGPALHALAIDGSRRLGGHYAIVPMDVTRDGRRRRAGKGEAFVVDPEFRGGTIAFGDDGPLAVGMALPLHLYRFALEQGMEVVHMVATPEVGRVHRMAGCRSVSGWHERARLATAPGVASGPTGRGLAVGQWLAFSAARLIQAAGQGGAVPLAGGWRARILANSQSSGGWTIALDEAVLEWFAGVGGLEVVTPGDRSSGYALVSPRAASGRVMEVLAWHPDGPSTRAATRLLAAIALHARRRGNVQVAVSLTSAPEQLRTGLRDAARRLWFRMRSQPMGLFVRSEDAYYFDPAHVRYSPFFHAVF